MGSAPGGYPEGAGAPAGGGEPGADRRRSPDAVGRSRPRRATRTAGALAAVAVLVPHRPELGGSARSGRRNHHLTGAVRRLRLSVDGGQNILIMGLDSRLDQHGNPLPQDVYAALHAGDETVGGYNANVLILIHVPDSGPAVAISIPRDDYVDIPGCPTGVCKGKIKQAYGLAYQQALNKLDADPASSNAMDPQAKEQAGREAGRKAQLATVRELLGVPIDHFVEVTLGAFFDIAKAVAPITVCLNEDTSDTFSGADFHRGVQQIDAAQAMAFVRQRRDLTNNDFTDMDRTRRQQAFMASLVAALRHNQGSDSPATMRKLLDVAKKNVAVDAGFDLSDFARHASALSTQPPSLYTLPILGFGQDPDGQDINQIDVPAIRSIVANLTTSGSAAPTETAEPTPASGGPHRRRRCRTGRHQRLRPRRPGCPTASRLRRRRLQERPHAHRGRAVRQELGANTEPDSAAPAQALATRLGLTAVESDTLPAGTVQVTTGTDFPADKYVKDSHRSGHHHGGAGIGHRRTGGHRQRHRDRHLHPGPHRPEPHDRPRRALREMTTANPDRLGNGGLATGSAQGGACGDGAEVTEPCGAPMDAVLAAAGARGGPPAVRTGSA